MPYIKLNVSSGGIYIKRDTKNNCIKRELISHPEPQEDNKNQKVLGIVRESSIKGLFSYLMGETKKLKVIEESSDSSVKKLNSTLDMMVKVSAYKRMTELYITTFFELRGYPKVKSKIKSPPKIHLSQHTFETANATIKLLKKPLKNIFETECLGEINKKIEDSKVKEKDSTYNDLHPPNCENIPESKLGTKMKNYFIERTKESKPIYQKTIEIIDGVNSLCAEDLNFKRKLEKSNYERFSTFTDPQHTKSWVDEKYYPVVRGAPAFIACTDFDIYLSEGAFEGTHNSDHFNWEEIIQKIQNGPNIARWGEGGIVRVTYHLDEMGCPYEQKDHTMNQLFAEIKDLRKSGIKIVLYDWEKTDEKEKSKNKE